MVEAKGFDVVKIQKVHLWLQVTTLADVCTEDGNIIQTEWYTNQLRRRKLIWPIQP